MSGIFFVIFKMPTSLFFICFFINLSIAYGLRLHVFILCSFERYNEDMSKRLSQRKRQKISLKKQATHPEDDHTVFQQENTGTTKLKVKTEILNDLKDFQTQPKCRVEPSFSVGNITSLVELRDDILQPTNFVYCLRPFQHYFSYIGEQFPD